MFRFDDGGALLETSLPLPKRSGKVRDVYDLGDRLLIVSTDRISAFDWVLPSGIPEKGRILTAMSEFWFGLLPVPNHWLSSDLQDAPLPASIDRGALEGRSMIVRKAKVIPFECVVRGYIEGSGWRDYQETGSICGIPLPKGLRQCDRLPTPIFTPATKAESGHDENVSFEAMAAAIGIDRATELRDKTLNVYAQASDHAASRGLLIADTKLEWGIDGSDLLLIDEVLTPDSSRFWPADQYRPGASQPSFDKQFVREYLLGTSWDRNSPAPPLPADVIERTAAKYREALDRIARGGMATK
jgi:phosphoribosylaminoimidazole-succinocarboxamide synthase